MGIIYLQLCLKVNNKQAYLLSFIHYFSSNGLCYAFQTIGHNILLCNKECENLSTKITFYDYMQVADAQLLMTVT